LRKNNDARPPITTIDKRKPRTTLNRFMLYILRIAVLTSQPVSKAVINPETA